MIPTCFMCRERPAKKLTGKTRDGRIYKNATNVVVFCSLRCAANYALLYSDMNSWHFCPASNQWIACFDYECDECKQIIEKEM